MSIAEHPAVIRFVRLAEQYCRLMETGTTSHKRLIRQSAELLPELLAAAIHLPTGRRSKRIDRELKLVRQSVNEEYLLTDRQRLRAKVSRYRHTFVSTERFFVISRRLARILGDHNLYREIFNPYKDRDFLETTISNDLAEIWHDLKPMLLLFEMGDEPAMRYAVYRWASDMRIHWADVHCCGVLKPLFFAVREVDWYWDCPQLAKKGRSKMKKEIRR